MDAWEEVLARRDSGLAWLLRQQLVGLRASMAAGSASRPDDTAREDVQRLLAQIDALLDSGTTLAPAPGQHGQVESDPFGWDAAPAKAMPPVQAGATAALDEIQSLVRADPRLDVMISADRWPSGGSGWWGAIHLATLALEAGAARRWRDGVVALVPAPGAAEAMVCAGPDDLLLVPTMPVTGTDGGLRIRPDGALDPRIADLSIQQPELDEAEQQSLLAMQRFVSMWLTLTERAPGLQHCLEAVNRHGTIALDGDQRERYEKVLIRRFNELVRSTDAPVEEQASARIGLDEAIQALLFDPLEEHGSRFALWKQQVRNLTLEWVSRARIREPSLQVRSLPEDYAQVQREGLTKRSDDIPLQGQRSGAVLATLRLWLRCRGRVEQGRALYGSG